jgi:peptidyl-prolyl cis-trans isomerase C
MTIRHPLIAATAAAILLAACGPADNAAVPVAAPNLVQPAVAAEQEGVVAVVNGTPITQAQFEAYAEERAMHRPMTGDPREREAILEEMINLELIVQDALRRDLDKDPEVVADLENQRRAILAGAAVRNHIEHNPISDEDVKREYDQRVADLSLQEYKARHILVSTEEEAKTVIDALEQGGDFAALADEKSLDDGTEGGDLGWFSPDQMVEPFSDAVAAMEKGSYTKAPVQTDFGWHVIFLEDVREIPPPPFEDMKERVRSFLQNQQINHYLVQLRDKAQIELR